MHANFLIILFFVIAEGIRVTLSVFSGRRNPHWSVTSRDTNYKKVTQLLAVAKQKGTKAIPARLGFRGFIVQDKMTSQVHVIVGRDTRELQLVLLETMPKGLLRKGTLKRVVKALRPDAVKKAAGKKRFKRYSPRYDPAPWHANEIVTLCNNCYNYVNIKRTNNTAVPGLGSGYNMETISIGEVLEAAISDGLKILEPHPGDNEPVPEAPGGDRHLVALVVAEGSGTCISLIIPRKRDDTPIKA